MGFTEEVKKQVKERAAFRCCRCQSIGVEVHHIIPQQYDGSSDIDNAAPLCSNCHSDFGDNPVKRKEIRQMRDWWYEKVTMMFPDNRQIERLEVIDHKLDELKRDQIGLDDFKQELFNYNQQLYIFTTGIIENMTLGTVIPSGTAIVNSSFSPSPSVSPSLSPSISPSASLSPSASPSPSPELPEED